MNDLRIFFLILLVKFSTGASHEVRDWSERLLDAALYKRRRRRVERRTAPQASGACLVR